MTYHSSQSGFSLVETLVAITILLLVIVGPMSISATAARSTSYASEQVIAFFLAQEGAEIAQKGRDDILLRNFLPPTNGAYISNPWTRFTDTTSTGYYRLCFQAAGCGLELSANTTGTVKPPIACSGTACDLYFSHLSGRSHYSHTVLGEETIFTRVIFMQATANREVKVTSRVYWRTGSQRQAQQVEVETYLFNVYGN